MGFREVTLFGFVLLLSGGNLCVATQDSLNASSHNALNQIPQEPVQAQTTDQQSNRTRDDESIRSGPVSYRLKKYELENPAVTKTQLFYPPVENPQTGLMEAAVGASEQDPLQAPGVDPPAKQVLVIFDPRVPAPPVSIGVRCGEGEVTIEVKQNFLGNGQLIRPSDLTLGGCVALGADEHILQFQTELQGCGSTLTMTEDSLIYSFSLVYYPTPIGKTVILKTNAAEVGIECRYQRRHYVSSNAVQPTWKLFSTDVFVERPLHFSLRLMTDDWQRQRPSPAYFLSDVMHVEAAVLQGRHIPLRVFVDSCVVTLHPDPATQPRYQLINNHGCLRDAKLTGAKSYFMQRSQEDKLHFQLKAFRFHQDPRNSLFITCHLKATPASAAIDSQHKACSFFTETNRWVASGGDNKVCSCCESSCRERRRRRRLAADAELQWEGMAALGPILLEEESCEGRPLEASPPAATRAVVLLGGAGAVLAAALLLFMAVMSCSRLQKPIGYSVNT
ncbi:uncharacterized protein V6R79_000629 [Siganus canaliculatus]